MLCDYIERKPTIESNRLIIRPFKPTDVDSLKEWTPNKDIYKYWGKNMGAVDKKPELLLEKKEKPSKSFHLYIEYKDNQKVIGDIYIYLIEKDIKAKIAIRLNPSYHNTGIGTEAVLSMCDFVFNHTEIKTIWTDVDAENIASIKMLEKANFIRTKLVNNGKMVSSITNFYIYELNK